MLHISRKRKTKFISKIKVDPRQIILNGKEIASQAYHFHNAELSTIRSVELRIWRNFYWFRGRVGLKKI